jgi:hypothetical protein
MYHKIDIWRDNSHLLFMDPNFARFRLPITNCNAGLLRDFHNLVPEPQDTYISQKGKSWNAEPPRFLLEA